MIVDPDDLADEAQRKSEGRNMKGELPFTKQNRKNLTFGSQTVTLFVKERQ